MGVKLINSRRSELEILADILSKSVDGAKKTEILYQVNLSYIQLRNYLSFLIDKGLIEKETDREGKTLYRTSEKGSELLEKLNEVISLLD
ncbi:MAG TPA: DUF4364 family protein [Thermoplasmatales archaeon]|nr:DUF4364 family protein [Thermoplasmatales archaeon]